MAKKVVPVEKNEYYDVTIESLTHDGLGVARVDGFPVFVANALVGEEINMKVTLVKTTYAFGRAVDYFVKSKERVEPACGIYKQCGGCQAADGRSNLQSALQCFHSTEPAVAEQGRGAVCSKNLG